MPLNIGYIELGGTNVYARIYYNTSWLTQEPTRDPGLAPLINGPRGYCLEVVNFTGERATLTVTGLSDNPITISIQKGDPVTGLVTTGPQAGRSRTASQMAALGFTTRQSVGIVQIGE